MAGGHAGRMRSGGVETEEGLCSSSLDDPESISVFFLLSDHALLVTAIFYLSNEAVETAFLFHLFYLGS